MSLNWIQEFISKKGKLFSKNDVNSGLVEQCLSKIGEREAYRLAQTMKNPNIALLLCLVPGIPHLVSWLYVQNHKRAIIAGLWVVLWVVVTIITIIFNPHIQIINLATVFFYLGILMIQLIGGIGCFIHWIMTIISIRQYVRKKNIEILDNVSL